MILVAALILVISIPVYYFMFSRLWQYELDEHNIILSTEDGREDSFLIIAIVTGLTILFISMLLVGLIILNRRMSRKIWQPFYKSLSQIQGFELHRQQRMQLGHTDIKEFNDLNDSLQKLIDGNLEIYKQQKEFADNASHELQTPLAIVQSKLELLLQHQSLTSDQYKIVEETLQALSRVGRINKNLLLLTKIDNSQFMDEEPIDLSTTLNSMISDIASFASDKKLIIKKSIDAGVNLKGNKILVELLINNLLTNAIRHSHDPGDLVITLDQRQFEITNPGTTSLATNQLFKRFASASSEGSGTGLGLALVKQICSRYGWTVSYSFHSDSHHFIVKF